MNEQLEDLTGLLGTPVYKRGTPQRAKLDDNIRRLSDRQDELTRLDTRAAGWTWESTGERWADWWESATLEQRNVYLRTMNVSVGYSYPPDPEVKKPHLNIELGNVGSMLEQLNPVGTAENLRSALQAAGDTELGGVEIWGA